MRIAAATATRIAFGPYAYRTLEDIGRTEEGRAYLAHLQETYGDPALSEAIRLTLKAQNAKQ